MAAVLLNPIAGAVAPKVISRNRELWHAAEKFESIFVQQLLSEMESARLGPDGLSGPGADIYRGMLNQQMAGKVAGQDPFGIARLLVEQLHSAASASHSGASAATAMPAKGGTTTVPRTYTHSLFSSAATVPYSTVSRRRLV